MMLTTATRMDQTVISLLGGHTFEGVSFTPDQFRALRRFYDFDETEPSRMGKASAEQAQAAYEEEQAKPAAERSYNQRGSPPPDLEKIAQGMERLHDAAGSRNIMRHAKKDGLRVMAFLSKYLELDEDPVVLVSQALAALDYDVELEEAEVNDDTA